MLNPSPRCGRCLLPPRWCVCAGARETTCRLRVSVLAHFLEDHRPSSTGHLIKRVLPDSARLLFRPPARLERSAWADPARELWILHAEGEPMPADFRAENIEVLLLDGTWMQAGDLARRLSGWGRRVRLPLTGESRYWLRRQDAPGRFSTAEALQHLLRELGEAEPARLLGEQFELHVFAHLCARGQRQRACEFLERSPAAALFPELVARLLHSRKHG